jgi:hypothetical protein
MIIVRLIGGLGNQMFQYAMARTLADRHDVALKLDIEDFGCYTLRRYELGDFVLRAEIASKDEIRALGADIKRLSTMRRLGRRLCPSIKKMVFREKAFNFDPRIERLTPPVYLDGYWQTERYFEPNAAMIRRDFSLRLHFDPANKQMLNQIEAVNAISLHVRRGDYVSDKKTGEIHGACSLDYYKEALRHIAERVDHPHFFIFSDDHSWVRKNISLKHPVTFVTTNSSDKGIFDMELMRNCKHHIIANSSFSWWGAWLNASTEKIIIAPKQWFNKAPHDTRDLIPHGWVTL